MKPGDLIRIKLGYWKHAGLLGLVLSRSTGRYYEIFIEGEVYYYAPDQVEVIAESGRSRAPEIRRG